MLNTVHLIQKYFTEKGPGVSPSLSASLTSVFGHADVYNSVNGRE